MGKPLAYFQPPTDNGRSLAYRATLKVASVVGIELRPLATNQVPGCDAYVLIDGRNDSTRSGGLGKLSPLERMAVMARRRLPFPNRFLYFHPHLNEDPADNALARFGLVVVTSLIGLVRHCSKLPRVLEDHSVKHILRTGLLADAIRIEHDFKNRPDDPVLRTAACAVVNEAVEEGWLTLTETRTASTVEIGNTLKLVIRRGLEACQCTA
jgi:hypothetical protein